MATQAGSKRGRPKKSVEDVQGIREKIIGATRMVFGEFGSPGTTVKRIIEAASISRPTFYKYFSNAEEPLDIIVEKANQQLVNQILQAVSKPTTAIDRILAVIDVYLEWGESEFDILASINQELMLPSSIVSMHRQNTLDAIYRILQKILVQEGESAPDRVLFNSLVIAAENIGYHILLSTEEIDRDKHRHSMLKLAIALFGEKGDWQKVATNDVYF